MKIEEAKSILQGYRPNGADAADPTFAEALKLVENDPALREWFVRQQTFDRVMCSEYEDVTAPAGLRERILAGATGAAPETSRRGWWHGRAPLWLGIAASVLVLIGATVTFWPKPKLPAANSSLADFAISDAQHPKTHGGKGAEAASLNHMLNLPTTRLSDPLPIDFMALRKSGARTLQLDGRDILEVCFKRNGVGLHCYVARRQDFPGLTAPPKPTVSDKTDASIATWADAANLYIVVTKPGRAALEKLL